MTENINQCFIINERRKWYYSEGVKKQNIYLMYLSIQKSVLFGNLGQNDFDWGNYFLKDNELNWIEHEPLSMIYNVKKSLFYKNKTSFFYIIVSELCNYRYSYSGQLQSTRIIPAVLFLYQVSNSSYVQSR